MVYAEADNVVPPTVILVIAALQEASSVKLTLKGASTDGEEAADNVGEVNAPEEIAETVPLRIILSNLSVLPELPPEKAKVNVILPVKFKFVFKKLVAVVVVKAPVLDGERLTVVDPPVPVIVTVSALGPVEDPLLSNPILVGIN
jgi:hypothetical protein